MLCIRFIFFLSFVFPDGGQYIWKLNFSTIQKLVQFFIWFQIFLYMKLELEKVWVKVAGGHCTVWRSVEYFKKPLLSSGQFFQCRMGLTVLIWKLTLHQLLSVKYTGGWWLCDLWGHMEEWTSKHLNRQKFCLHYSSSKLSMLLFCPFFSYGKLPSNSTVCPETPFVLTLDD